MGHDWGGIVAFKAAIDFPDRFTRLALIDTLVSVWIPWGIHGYWFKCEPRAEQFMAEHGSEGPITGTGTTEEFVQALERPRTIMAMVKAGPAVDAVIEELTPLLDEGDTIVDGGNTNWHDDQRRAKELEPKGIKYADVGTSGGVWGLDVGYCMMAGGPDESIADAAEAPHPVTTPDEPAEVVDIESGKSD